MFFGVMIEITVQALQRCEKPKVGRRGLVSPGLFNEPYNAHRQQMEHIVIGSGLSLWISSLGRCQPHQH